MLALAFMIYTRNVNENGLQVSIQYSFETLQSGQRFDINVRDGASKYYVALTTDAHLDNVVGTVWIQYSLGLVGLVYRAYSLQLRYCKINVRGFYSYLAYIAKLADTVTLYQSEVVFRNSSNAVIDYFPSVKILSLTSEKRSIIIQNTPYGIKEDPPCVSCIKPDQIVADNCFGCIFGFVYVGKTCSCMYNGSTFYEDTRRCERRVTDLISDGTQYYLSECTSNSQITSKFTGSITSTGFAVLKNDNCGITNLMVDGAAIVSGTIDYISGLVRYVTRNLNNVFSSLTLNTTSSFSMASLICNYVTTNVTISSITLNGILSNSNTVNKTSPVGGIVSLVNGGFAITIKTIRFLGLYLLVYECSFVSLFVGYSDKATLSFSDIMVAQYAHDNFTATPVSAAGLSFDDVSFTCKQKAYSEEMKDAMKLKLFTKKFELSTKDTTLSYHLRQSGGLIGSCNDSSVTVANLVMLAYINSSVNTHRYYDSVGFLVGNLTYSNMTVNGAYLSGKTLGRDKVGVVAEMIGSKFDSVMAVEIFLNGNTYGGVIAFPVNSTIGVMKVAVHMTFDSYLYNKGLLGQPNSLTATIQEAFGYVYLISTGSTYAYSASNLQINGAPYSGSVTNVPNLYINNC